MSALDEFLSQYDNEADWVNDCRAELAQLNSTIESWIALWKYICHATNCEGYLPNEQNFDSMLDNAPRYVALRATVAEQAKRLAEAQELIDQSETDAMAIVNMSDGHVCDMAEHLANQLGYWLAEYVDATAAPQPDEAQ